MRSPVLAAALLAVLKDSPSLWTRPAGTLCVVALCATLLSLTGCEPAPEAEFARPDGYDELFEEIRTGVRDAEVEDWETGEVVKKDLVGFDEALAQRFGTPADPAVYTALPVTFSEPRVIVSDVVDDEEAETTTFTLTVDGEGSLPEVAAGDELHWNDELGGAHTAAVASIEGDAVTVPLVSLEARPSGGYDPQTFEPRPGPVVIGDATLLKEGRALYEVHCVHCHGDTGAGDGPTAKYLYPPPRNFRPGVYKFTSTGSGVPSRDDLRRVLREGVPGTYMPSFHPALGEEEKDAVIEYVRWLSMEGKYTQELIAAVSFSWGPEVVAERLESDPELTHEDLVKELTGYWDQDVTGNLGSVGTVIGDTWSAVDRDSPVTPTEPRPELTGEELTASVLRGRAVYLQANAQCASCHGPRGLGNGPQTVVLQPNAATGQMYAEPGLHDAWGDVVRPRNLTRGIYRGGRRPIDLYRRVHSGIIGSNMPGFGSVLSDAQIWDLVNFLLALPLEPSLLEGAEPETTGHDAAVVASPGAGSTDASAATAFAPPAVPSKQADQS